MADQHSSKDRRATQGGRSEDDHDSRGFLQVAEEYRREGEIATAVELLLAGLEKHPNYISAQVALGRCYLEQGEPKEARRLLERVVDQDVTHLVAAKLLVETHIQRRDPAQAERQLNLYNVLNNSDPDIEPLRARIEALREKSTASEATEDPATTASADATSAQAAVEETQRQSGDSDGSTSAEPPQANPPARSLSLAESGEPFPSLQVAGLQRRYLEQLGGDGIFPVAASSLLLGEPAEDKVGDQGDHEAQPEVAVASDRPPATVTVAELYLAQGHEEDAKRIYREVLAAQPDHEAAKLGLARLESTHSVVETEVDPPQEIVDSEHFVSREDPASEAMTTAPQDSLLERKKSLLMRYLQTLRQEP